jgi:hypothetical protein
MELRQTAAHWAASVQAVGMVKERALRNSESEPTTIAIATAEAASPLPNLIYAHPSSPSAGSRFVKAHPGETMRRAR